MTHAFTAEACRKPACSCLYRIGQTLRWRSKCSSRGGCRRMRICIKCLLTAISWLLAAPSHLSPSYFFHLPQGNLLPCPHICFSAQAPLQHTLPCLASSLEVWALEWLLSWHMPDYSVQKKAAAATQPHDCCVPVALPSPLWYLSVGAPRSTGARGVALRVFCRS